MVGVGRLQSRIDRDDQAGVRHARLRQLVRRRIPRRHRRGQAGDEGPHVAAPADPFRDSDDAGDVVVVEDTVGRVNGRLLIARRIPPDRQSWCDVVVIFRERVPAGAGDVVLDVRPELVLVPHAKFERQVGLQAPVVLRKKGDVLVDVGAERLAIALDVAGGQAERHRLNAADRHGQESRNGRQRGEDVTPAKMQRETAIRVIDVVEVEAGLELVIACVVADAYRAPGNGRSTAAGA